MHKVQVLLSSYNGENYIRQQLNSILNQEKVDVSVLVRDDGSKDTTPLILQEYSEKYSNLSYLHGRNAGVVASFFRLFNLADTSADFFALSDQDDYWDNDKLFIACSRLSSIEGPALYCCASSVTDDELNELHPDAKKKELNPSFGNAIIENIAVGGGIVFNRALLEMVRIPMPLHTFMHDWWLYITASCFGTVIYDSTPHYKYRQHQRNVLGAASNKFISKLLRRFNQSKTNKNHISNQMKSFARIYDIPDDKAELVNIITNYSHDFSLRKKGISGKYFFRQSKLDNIIFRLMFFSNHL